MKKILFALLISICSFSLSAQELSTLILSMPNNVIMGIEADQKIMLTDNNVLDTTLVKIQTPIYESIVRTAYTPDYIALKTSEAGTTQIKLLPLINDSKILCVIKTVSGKISDSSISFYTTNWQPIRPESIFPVKSIDWFLKPDIDKTSDEYKNVTAVIDMLPVVLSFNEKDDSITATFDIKGYLSEEDYKNLQPYLSESPKKLEWNKTTYK